MQEINLITTVPVVIQMRNDGNGWYVNQVVVCDEDIDMDLKHIEAEDHDAILLPNTHEDVIEAFHAAQTADEWPTWEFGW